MKRLFAVAALLCLASPVLAQDYPLLSATRLSAAVGSNYVWYSAVDNRAPRDPMGEFDAGLYVSYSLLSSEPTLNSAGQLVSNPILSLAGSSLYGLDSRELRTSLGLRLVLMPGGSK